jgi:hypothetical protein
MSNERLFTIQPGDFDTGVCSDGRQVVMGLLCPHLVAYFFDLEGNVLGGERRLWERPAERMSNNGPYILHSQGFCEALDRQKQSWKDQLGFQTAAIRLKQFFDSENFVGIEPLPHHYKDLESDKEIEGEERQQLEEMRESWMKDGSFVWWWCEEYYMSKDGAVEST